MTANPTHWSPVGIKPTPKPRPDTTARLEDADWLLSFGIHPAEVAARVGLKIDSLSRMYYRAGRPNQTIENERKRQRRQTRTTTT